MMRRPIQENVFLLSMVLICYFEPTRTCIRGSAFSDNDSTPDDNPCRDPNNPCLNGGICSINGDSYDCECQPGFSGTNCEHGVCDPNPCLNGGNCKITPQGNAECHCADGWIGESCTVVDPCFPNPCYHDGKCISDDNGENSVCLCKDPWIGEFCDTNGNSTTMAPTRPTIKTTTTHAVTSTTTHTTTTFATTRDPNYLRGCSAITESKCHGIDDIIIETIEEVDNTQVCQFNCNFVYASTCKYFLYDVEYKECKILNTVIIDFCQGVAAGITTNIEDCVTVFEDDNEEVSCLNFREHLCGYEDDVLEDLVQIPDKIKCQQACEHRDECEFFRHDAEMLNCQLLRSGKRNCGMVRGTPQPDFEQCKQDGNIYWP